MSRVDPAAPLASCGRDFDAQPYTADEQRVAEWLVARTGVGAGDDPLGFLMASLALAITERNRYKDALVEVGRMALVGPHVAYAVRKALDGG